MASSFQFLVLATIITLMQVPKSCSYSSRLLTRGSSLSVDNKDDVLVSLNGYFTAGFNQVGENAYVFAVWLTEQTTTKNRDMVWMANRDAPVKKKHSKLSLWDDGNLVLTDADEDVIWSTNTKSTSSSVQLQLNGTGNLMLHDKGGDGQPLWQSFDHPTDTLLPNQPFTKNTQLISSKSSMNYGSGFYKLLFDDDSILRLHYNGPETTTVFWPDPWLTTWDAMRFQYIDTRRAILDSDGKFNSSDGFLFMSADYGVGPQRIMRIDIDGNLRVYSLVKHGNRKKWEVQWQAISHSCKIHGTCGPNSLCTYSPNSGRKCTCLHGYKMVNSMDWSYGCEPEFEPCIQDDCGFIFLRHVEFYGHDVRFMKNITLDACKKDCLNDNTCKGFQFRWKEGRRNTFCYIKTSLYNGYQMGFNDSMYIKMPKRLVSSFHQRAVDHLSFSWSSYLVITPTVKSYEKTHHDKKPFRSFLVLGCIIGFVEIMCISFFWYHSSKNLSTNEASQFLGVTTFRKFKYSELKKATSNFSEEIGRGGACIVYKGKLSDNRIAAIKKLQNNTHQGEAEFQAEISTIGRVNHMNLIETWGYCAEGKHRLVVYEYMKNGSLAENLVINDKLHWATRLDIAIGTAKGLAYLHEECLEWVLHCDVKPHNILLDVNYKAKVADFGLSKLLDRSSIDQLNFSMVRGTRGYMAPEWVLNFPITAKVDVFSYGVVILEMITGRSPAGKHHTRNENGKTVLLLIEWVRDKIQEFDRRMESWIEEIIDPTVCGEYDRTIMEKMVRIALQCANEDRETRPSMSEVVDMLLHVN